MAIPLSITQINDIIQWDIRTWSGALDFWQPFLSDGKEIKALELGGREGGLSLWLALQGYQVVCSDIGDVATIAKPLHQKYGVSNAVSYQEIDATNIPYENHFDVIAFKSIIGGIGRNGNKQIQQVVFDQIYKALKPGGVLIFAENLTGSALHRWLRRKFVRWGNEWRYVTAVELHGFLHQFSKHELRLNGCLSAFGRSESQRNLLSYADTLLFNHVVSDGAKYVAYGVAVK